ncbi:phosphate regulon sensor histidine kinase PhoR [Methylocaldum sp. 14B]|jgi:two-component system phosphate regulon sensor histidine kinase PhoR|uniref:phosphate regulon sensor histidine kinase PhoR n=1 Tax=unclassified Methylocaldum TaxID=2622260 RepID=UPI00098BA330|nr:phosphate regulon sensor histidine kinase PhoR [Methylocaldum sp. 14B]MVF23469.1 phosphate regulon sensor histidine kinase PhoR [Methylocaldum sp. BRCS4]
MSSPWRSEFSFLFLTLLVGTFLGKVLNSFAVVLWVCLLAYLARQLFYANRLLVWLRSGRSGQPPQGNGVWEEIYYLIYRLRRRNKRRKKQLIRMLERFRTATAALPDATVVLGPRDEIDWFNEAAERLLGLRRGDIGQQIGNLLRHPKLSQYLQTADYRATVSIPSPLTENMQLEIRIVPYGEDLRLLVAQDVTQLRFMERVRSDFVANVSHELRTPLTVLKGYLETLGQVDGSLPESHLKVFQRMEEQTARMESLVDGLLALTRLESAAHQTVQKRINVPAMLQDICDEVKLLADEHPAIELVLETDAHLLGAEQELRSAFSNLIVNAVKYTPATGRVTVRWRCEGKGARLDVEDTGPGIAQHHLPRLTERFYRVAVDGCKNKGGSGLGLAIVKHALSRHGGELKIASTLGRGSCFSCSFPEDRIVRVDSRTDAKLAQRM